METNDDGLVLKSELVRLNITPYKLSKLLGFKSPDSIYHIINGRNKLSKHMLNKLEKSSLGFNTSLFYANKNKQDNFNILFRTGELLNQISFQFICGNLDQKVLEDSFKILFHIGDVLKHDEHSSDTVVLSTKNRVLEQIKILFPSLASIISKTNPESLSKLNFLEIADLLFADNSEERLLMYFSK